MRFSCSLICVTFNFAIYQYKDNERPSNDDCDAAKSVADGFNEIGGTRGATPDFATLTCEASEVVRGVWYEYEATEDKIVNVDITASTFKYRVVLFSGDSCAARACVGFDSVSGTTSTFQSKNGTKYFILVTGASSFTDVGTFSISVMVRAVALKPKSRFVLMLHASNDLRQTFAA
jgi:hypothetical protein